LALIATGAARAGEPVKPQAPQCFRSESYRGFHAVNDHAFNIRVNVHDFYRIELEGSCPMITSPGAFLETHVRGSDLICGPLDWDLRVRESGAGAISSVCIVKSQTLLTPDEVAAMPPKERP
jgi:hypothetical protein